MHEPCHASLSVLLCQGPSDLGVPEGAGVSGQDGCDWGSFSVRFHRVLVFRKQSVHDGELLCVLVLRWIFKDAPVQRTLRTKLLHTIFVNFSVWWFQYLNSKAFPLPRCVLLFFHYKEGKRKECLKNFSSGATLSYNFPGLLDFRNKMH